MNAEPDGQYAWHVGSRTGHALVPRFLFLLLRYKKSAKRRRRSSKRAPMTPPTIAPTFGRLAACAVSVTAGFAGSTPEVEGEDANALVEVVDA